MEYYQKEIEEIFREFNTKETGLTEKQAEKKLENYGKNIIKKTNNFRPLKIFFSQFNSFLIYILLFASIVMFFLEQYLDAGVIFAIVLLNSGIGFFQQYKAEKAIEGLKKMIIPKSKVLRNGHLMEIPSEMLVPGDIIVFSEGDKINADCRIFELENAATNEAILTGESLSVTKSIEKINSQKSLAEQKNMLFMGTQLVKGNAKAIVVSTGMNTVFGKIAGTLQEMEVQTTPMQKRLDKFSKQLGIITIGLVFFVLLLGLIQKMEFFDLFLTSVALAIGAIPEGLPAVLAIAFSISSVMLSKQNVIIRRLPAVESLGSVTVICSDKTGTITEEKMQVQQFFANNKFYSKKDKINLKSNIELYNLLKTSVLCNNARYEGVKGDYKILGDPTEGALVESALNFEIYKKELIEQEPSIQKFEFDSKRKMMSIARENGRNISFYSKGAPESILQKSSFELINGKVIKLTDKRKKELLTESKKMEENALRVLAFANKTFSKKESIIEEGLIFLGFAGMLDPPRKEVANAIKECVSAGIKVKIITGDSAVTAKAIAKQIGIEGRIVTEDEISKMNDEELMNILDEVAIFARATPHQKLRITKLLQEKGETVAITGDGINDVLALKSADIGISMGKRGTDVARDVSDIVLIDDNFVSLVEGVKQGRKTYDNIKKFTKYMLSVNFSEIFLVGILALLKMPLPILPLQILWKNLVTDSFPALTLVLEDGEDVMNSKPRKEKWILGGIWKFIIMGGILNFFACLGIYIIGMMKNLPIEEIRTLVLTTGILFELTFVYVCRSDKSLFNIGIFSNKWLNYAIIFAFVLHLILLYSPLGIVFELVFLTLKDWILIIPFALSGIVFFEIGKIIRNKIKK